MSLITRLTIQPAPVAYFSMEVGIEPAMPTYSGGLGVLAGDTLHAAADLGINMVGMTLLYRKGYFQQVLDKDGGQFENPVEWSPRDYLEPLPQRTVIEIENRHVQLRPWLYVIRGIKGHDVPVYFLDSDLPDNDPIDQTLTDYLYGGDSRYRLCQEAVLGLGGMSMLRALGHTDIQTYHMNEGHSSLLVLALLGERTERRSVWAVTKEDLEAVRCKCVFTTHTPVPAGHDKFPKELVQQVLGPERRQGLESAGCYLDGVLNMTNLALISSHYINGVSMRHEEISRDMFPEYPINSITNGVHAVTWVSQAFSSLYDHYIPEWRRDNLYLRYAISIPKEDIQSAHKEAKKALIEVIERRAGIRLDSDIMTLGFARRATAYKRAALLFSDLERLRKIVKKSGPLQVVYAGKAHPRDESGKALIRSIFDFAASLKDVLKVIYLEDYDMEIAKYICAGVDLWLNTPQKPHEASGTSGMKAALNGVPSLSVLDGWWVEGHIEGITGWSICEEWEGESDSAKEAVSLYEKLENVIMPMYYERPMDYAKVMRSTIAINGSYYNAGRMVFQYLANAYS